MAHDNAKSESKQARTRKPSAIQKLRQRVAKRDPAEILAFERRCLVGATAGLLVAFVFWTVAVSTDFWFHVVPESGGPIYINRTNSFFIKSHSGLWTICKFQYVNGSLEGPEVKNCHNHRLFPTEEFINKNPEVDRTILDYTRTETAFAIITFCLIAMGFGFAVYTFKEPRYMFKRLAGGVHFIGAGASLVVIEVVINSVEYEEQYLTDRHPRGAVWTYGYSFAFACLTFIVMLISGLTFMICSRKKKGDRSGGVQGVDDEPHILGRM
ncbi:hypothetical protein AVEN_42877-1 [Araneus ventricosus]|uniref:Voltage-dependent calcium channel gamma-1 subunit n=1 Tax=Araneus ventricosus TaxID=182803 RepID=A0A4Y2AER1_ARAVE|nr:hypothetical protein AVEN_42877-1 [Araneus ventricosus]